MTWRKDEQFLMLFCFLFIGPLSGSVTTTVPNDAPGVSKHNESHWWWMITGS